MGCILPYTRVQHAAVSACVAAHTHWQHGINAQQTSAACLMSWAHVCLQVKSLVNQRLDPNWSFSSLYLVKDSLALMLEVREAWRHAPPL